MNISGIYAFNTKQACENFSQYAKTIDSTAPTCKAKPASRFVIMPQKGTSGSLTLYSLLTLIIMLVWGWIATRRQSHIIRFTNGVPTTAIAWQDTIAFVKIYAIPALITLALVCLYYALWHRTPFTLNFTLSCCISVLAVIALLGLLCFIFTVVLCPTVSQIGHRTTAYKQTQIGTALIKIVALFLVFLAVPQSIVAVSSAYDQMESAARWRNYKNAVAVQVGGTEEDYEKTVPAFTQFLKSADSSGDLNLSYNVSTALLDNQNHGNVQKAMLRESHNQFDNVIVTSQSFLNTMKLSSSNLKRITEQDLNSASLKNSLKSYNSIWMNKDSKDSLFNHMYVWKGSEKFPALDSSHGTTGRITASAKPLILVFDKPTDYLSVSSFLIPALTSANIFFTNESVVNKLINDAHLQTQINSVVTIADSALYEAQMFEQMFAMSLCTLFASIIVIIIAAAQSARIWSAHKRKTIFLLMSSGHSHLEIISHSVLVSTVLILAVAGVTYAMQQAFWLSIAYSYFILAGAIVACIALESIFYLRACAKTFTNMSLRKW
ncbi:hypothetical protein [Alloscardovia omnicolens]|uniref:hypothetical protein n=1 Tax=Alloscardovia omnicolens TaxID=419015 RepID=UPI003A614A2B